MRTLDLIRLVYRRVVHLPRRRCAYDEAGGLLSTSRVEKGTRFDTLVSLCPQLEQSFCTGAATCYVNGTNRHLLRETTARLARTHLVRV
jgi:hypothetical protein